ncbi:MAG: caspase family protein, partial [Verrucomicrobiota bacterium]
MKNQLTHLLHFCLVVFLYQTVTSGADRVALVIGNSSYPTDSLFGRIPMAQRDADLIASTLEDLGFEVILTKNASKSVMYGKLLDLEDKIQPGGTVLVYFAGHGIEFEKKNYLMASNARFRDRDLLGEESLEADIIVKKLSRKNPKTTMIFLDCCREAPPTSWLTSHKKTRNANTLGLAEMETGPGLVIGFAASAGNLANDSLGDQNGPYALALSKYMNSGEEFNRVLKLVGREVNARSIQMKKSLPNDNGLVIQEPRMYGQLYHDFYYSTTRREIDVHMSMLVTDDSPQPVPVLFATMDSPCVIDLVME